MKTILLNTAKEVKKIKRASITNINGVAFNEMYPMLDVSNQHVSYYSVEKQRTVSFFPPYQITIK